MIRDFLRRALLWPRVASLLFFWRVHKLMANPEAAPPGEMKFVAILPPDTTNMMGSKGDEALIMGCVAHLRQLQPSVKIGVITDDGHSAGITASHGLIPLPIWTQPWSLGKVMRALRAAGADRFVLLGADCMDGYYSGIGSAKSLVTADVAALHGFKSVVAGFSFNASAWFGLRPFYKRLGVGSGLLMTVRDPVSLKRVHAFGAGQARLSADVAFLLPPISDSAPVLDVKAWVEQRRAAGDLVIGFNMHPMLFKHGTPEQWQALADAGRKALLKVGASRRVSFVLLPHDFRGGDMGDDAVLDRIAPAASQGLPGRVLYVNKVLLAAEYKGITGFFDGMVTARMHLAIAALGQGVPIASMTYQDKFDGLLQHFGLPANMAITPQETITGDNLEALILRLVDNVDALRSQVATTLPAVKAAAASSFEYLK